MNTDPHANPQGWRIFPRWLMEEHDLASLFNSQLSTGQAEAVTKRIQQYPGSISALTELLGDVRTPLSTRIGIGVVMEDLAGSDILQKQVRILGKFSTNKDARIRADACYYLGLSGNNQAIPYLSNCLQDTDEEVREVAQDALTLLTKS